MNIILEAFMPEDIEATHDEVFVSMKVADYPGQSVRTTLVGAPEDLYDYIAEQWGPDTAFDVRKELKLR